MFTTIMVPVDLTHADKLTRALDIAATVAHGTNAELVFVGVTSGAPSAAAHTPAEFKARLSAFAQAEAQRTGTRTRAETVLSHDPAVSLGDDLIRQAKALGADAIVMASHVPGLAEHVFASNAGYVASHAPVSVFVVR